MMTRSFAFFPFFLLLLHPLAAQVPDYLAVQPRWVFSISNGFNYPCIEEDTYYWHVSQEIQNGPFTFYEIYEQVHHEVWSFQPPPFGCQNTQSYFLPPGIAGYMYQDSLKIYLATFPDPNASKQLLADYGLQVGDTLTGMGVYSVVSQIDTVLLGGDSVKTWIFNPDQLNLHGQTEYAGMLTATEWYLCGWESGCGLNCYGQDGVELLGSYCQFTLGEAETTAASIQAYPSPAEDFLYLSQPVTGHYTVYSISGQVLLSGMLNQENRVSLLEIPAGFYVIEFSNAGEKFHLRFVRA